MNIKPIKSKTDYNRTLKQIEKLMEAKPNSPEGDILNILAILVNDYEEKHYAIYPPDPIEAIKFRMEQLGLKNKDIAKLLGGANRVSEILNRKRDLTVKMIRELNKELGIPAESLLGQ
jgi:HTH-type transcriptional regulator / antitoxin HigA